MENTLGLSHHHVTWYCSLHFHIFHLQQFFFDIFPFLHFVDRRGIDLTLSHRETAVRLYTHTALILILMSQSVECYVHIHVHW